MLKTKSYIFMMRQLRFTPVLQYAEDNKYTVVKEKYL
jgi:hypothetical protein